MAAAMPEKPAESESYEQIVERLTRLVESLERGDLSLAQSLDAFEQGVKLVRGGTRLLDEAEQRVELLLRGPDGRERTEPFDAGAAPKSPGRPAKPSGEDDVPF